MRLEEFLKGALGYKTVQATGRRGTGDISSGESYRVDGGQTVFVKRNGSAGAKQMFEGEFASLEAIQKTGCIRVPRAIKVLDSPEGRGAILVMESLNLEHMSSKNSALLGTQLAKMHLYNVELGEKGSPDYVDKFGFHVVTCCGSTTQCNTWDHDWTSYYAAKLQEQMDLAENNYKDREAANLWFKLKPKIPNLFEGLQIKPSLVHGDLWAGNVGQADGKPVIYDPASFYGHHEYDLGIAGMFGGFSSDFYDAYHKLIPRSRGFDSRHELYKLYHYVNHWNLFGGGYRSSSLRIMTCLTSK